MDKRAEIIGVLSGLGIGLLLAMLGVIGAMAGLGYFIAVLVLMLVGVGILGGVLTAFWQWAAPSSARKQVAYPEPILHAVSTESPSQTAAEPLSEWLREVRIFQGLTKHELELIADAGERRILEDGEWLASQGDRGDTLYVILSGQLRLTSWGASGEMTVRFAGPKEAIPVAVLLDFPILVTSVQVVKEAVVLAILRERLIELCYQKPIMGMLLYKAVAMVLRERYRATLAELTGSMRSTVDLGVV